MTSPDTGAPGARALPLSVIDFATVRPGQTVGEALQDSVELARKAGHPTRAVFADEDAVIRLTAKLLGVTDRESAVARQEVVEARSLG